MDLIEDQDEEIKTCGRIYWRTVLWGSILWFPFFKVVETEGPINLILLMLVVNIAFSLLLAIMGYSDYKAMKIQQSELSQREVIVDGY